MGHNQVLTRGHELGVEGRRRRGEEEKKEEEEEEGGRRRGKEGGGGGGGGGGKEEGERRRAINSQHALYHTHRTLVDMTAMQKFTIQGCIYFVHTCSNNRPQKPFTSF